MFARRECYRSIATATTEADRSPQEHTFPVSLVPASRLRDKPSTAQRVARPPAYRNPQYGINRGSFYRCEIRGQDVMPNLIDPLPVQAASTWQNWEYFVSNRYVPIPTSLDPTSRNGTKRQYPRPLFVINRKTHKKPPYVWNLHRGSSSPKNVSSSISFSLSSRSPRSLRSFSFFRTRHKIHTMTIFATR